MEELGHVTDNSNEILFHVFVQHFILLKLDIFNPEATNFFIQIVKAQLAERKKTGLKRNDFIDAMAKASLNFLFMLTVECKTVKLYKNFKGFLQGDIEGENGEKIFKRRARLDVRKHSFALRVVDDWNSLPPSVVSAETLNQFKARLDRHWVGERFTNPFS